jgi:hypothetical protein
MTNAPAPQRLNFLGLNYPRFSLILQSCKLDKLPIIVVHGPGQKSLRPRSGHALFFAGDLGQRIFQQPFSTFWLPASRRYRNSSTISPKHDGTGIIGKLHVSAIIGCMRALPFSLLMRQAGQVESSCFETHRSCAAMLLSMRYRGRRGLSGAGSTDVQDRWFGPA